MNYKEALEQELKNPNFRKEYEALESEYNLIQSLIDARNKKHVTQKELSEATGIAQSDISKIENGSGNPTIKLLQRLANGLNMNLKISFEPKSEAMI